MPNVIDLTGKTMTEITVQRIAVGQPEKNKQIIAIHQTNILL